MKDKVASALGEAELLRIEMERFQKSIGDDDRQDQLRIVELETAIQDQALDVDTAIQLERLEEVERAIIALDPAQFVRRNEVPATCDDAARTVGDAARSARTRSQPRRSAHPSTDSTES